MHVISLSLIYQEKTPFQNFRTVENFFFSIYRIPPSLYPEYHKEDEDVSEERDRVTNNTTSGNSVTVSNLSKVS